MNSDNQIHNFNPRFNKRGTLNIHTIKCIQTKDVKSQRMRNAIFDLSEIICLKTYDFLVQTEKQRWWCYMCPVLLIKFNYTSMYEKKSYIMII